MKQRVIIVFLSVLRAFAAIHNSLAFSNKDFFGEKHDEFALLARCQGALKEREGKAQGNALGKGINS